MAAAHEIMPPHATCIGAAESVPGAAQRMTDLRVGALPICGTDQLLKGMLTDRDIVVKVLGADKDPATCTARELALLEALSG
ncbi:hypothetical protein PUR59_01930 [Streptomyces sp. SP18ES09]|uniref:CBS domain-containing protein n=1 Tax=Streptomyces sp. SP18ES09 TaxID=3002532 RepID=UPI002E7A53E9|nr:CBS domain-containing protein [Streptomyces sp. SP18ES09]MEE1813793.1 hypothetical protein [Streptomyces sp. SP18ES09]